VRFGGDAAAAAAVYQGIDPLRAADVAEAVRWVAAQPPRANVDLLVITSKDQIGPDRVKPA
jgi:NADP-dependent 3-hydroxy acid dehydrogenase YdfG